MSKHKRRMASREAAVRKQEAVEFKAPPESAERLLGERAAAEAIARAEVELPPVRGEFDQPPPDYERP